MERSGEPLDVRPLQRLAGRRVLIAEDVFLEGEDMRQAVTSAGADVLGPVPSVEQALRLLDHARPDVALLNYQLGDGTICSPVAARFAEMKTPFVIVTGFPREVLPQHLRDAAYLSKPFTREELLEVVLHELGLPTGL